MPTDSMLRDGRKAPRQVLIGAMVLAALIQIVVAVRSPVIGKDSITFISIGRDLLRDPVHTMRSVDQHPGYPALVVAGWRVLG